MISEIIRGHIGSNVEEGARDLPSMNHSSNTDRLALQSLLGQSRLLLLYIAFVTVYSCYVFLWKFPQTKSNIAAMLKWGKQVSDMRWRSSDDWLEIAVTRMNMTGGRISNQLDGFQV